MKLEAKQRLLATDLVYEVPVDIKGTKVFVHFPPYLFLNNGKGEPCSVMMSLNPNATNRASITVSAPQVKLDIDAYGYETAKKQAKNNIDKAIKVAKQYVAKNGFDELEAAQEEDSGASAKYELKRMQKVSKAPKGMKSLPKGYMIVPYKGSHFVKTPEGAMIPNQGTTPYKTTQDLIDNFYAWQALNK